MQAPSALKDDFVPARAERALSKSWLQLERGQSAGVRMPLADLTASRLDDDGRTQTYLLGFSQVTLSGSDNSETARSVSDVTKRGRCVSIKYLPVLSLASIHVGAAISLTCKCRTNLPMHCIILEAISMLKT